MTFIVTICSCRSQISCSQPGILENKRDTFIFKSHASDVIIRKKKYKTDNEVQKMDSKTDLNTSTLPCNKLLREKKTKQLKIYVKNKYQI